MKIIIKNIFLILVVICCSFSQNVGEFDKQNSIINSSLINQQIPVTPISDGAIDPNEYIVGPGDVYNVSLWISPPILYTIPVTPEGTLIIPTVGEIFVSGMKLVEAKKKVISQIKKKYIAGDASFTLLFPRTLSVVVQGNNIKDGKLYFQSNERISAVLARISVLKENTLGTESQNLSPKKDDFIFIDTIFAKRKIIVTHKDGSTDIADIEKYYATGNPRYNPLVRDGDVITFPKRNIEKDFISVYGAVNKEGVYEFVDEDSLFVLLQIAGGFTSIVDSSKISITRDNKNTFFIDLKNNKNVLLQRGDRIVVYEKPIFKREYKVLVEGEVISPGYYPITKDSTTLSEIIKSAGGFTEFASLQNARIFRSENKKSQEKFRGQFTTEDSVYLGKEISLPYQPVVADFVNLFIDKKNANDFYLQDGDNIVIPSQQKSVYVFGQVKTPGHVSFIANKDYQYYIVQAGGYTDDALTGDIRIVKAKTKQWLLPSETTIEEGDYVWIPKEPYRTTTYYTQQYSQIFGIIGSVASVVTTVLTALVLINQLEK